MGLVIQWAHLLVYICINCFSVKRKQALTHYRCYFGINYSCNFFGGSIFLWQKHIYLYYLLSDNFNRNG